MPVYEDSSDKFLSENQLTEQLLLILKNSNKNDEPVGILTSEHRDTLATAYERLTKGNCTFDNCRLFLRNQMNMLKINFSYD